MQLAVLGIMFVLVMAASMVRAFFQVKYWSKELNEIAEEAEAEKKESVESDDFVPEYTDIE